jgi:uncharacterized protein YkwD
MRVSAWGTVALGILAALAVAAPSGAAGPTQIESLDSLNEAIVARINVVRARYGLRPFILNPLLSKSADRHSRAMGTYGFFAHESRDGTTYRNRIRRDYRPAGYNVWNVGETIEFDSEEINAAEAVSLWMGSPPHRAALLDRTWREIGVSAIRVTRAPGIYEGDDITLVTADFGVRR